MSSDLLVVIGATGTQGASVIKHARAQHPNLAIRAVTRNTTSAAAMSLQIQGVELIQGSLEDEASLVAAFKDATLAFAMTDYWSLMLTHIQTKHPDPFTTAYNDEIQQGKNIISAASQNLATLRHLIFSSLPSPSKVSAGKYTTLHHFEAKAEIESILKQNEALAQRTTVVWAGYYMENIERWGLSDYLRPRKDASTGEYVLATPLDPSTPLELLATADDFGKFGEPAFPVNVHPPTEPQADRTPATVAPLLIKTPSPIPVLAASTTLTFPTIAAALSRRLAVPITYRQRPRGEMQRLYGEFGAVFEDMYSYFWEWGFAGEEKFVGRQEMGLEGKLTSFEDFIVGKKWEGFLVEDVEEQDAAKVGRKA